MVDITIKSAIDLFYGHVAALRNDLEDAVSRMPQRFSHTPYACLLIEAAKRAALISTPDWPDMVEVVTVNPPPFRVRSPRTETVRLACLYAEAALAALPDNTFKMQLFQDYHNARTIFGDD